MNDWNRAKPRSLNSISNDETQNVASLHAVHRLEICAKSADTEPTLARPDLLTTFSNWIENCGLTQSPNTVRTYRTCLRHLRDMQRVERYAIDFDTVSHGFGEKFARYLLTKRNLIDSVINKNLFRIKHFLVWAQENGYPVVVEPKQFRWQHQEPGILTLTRAEVQRLADLKLLKKLEGPVWLKIFTAEFGVKLSSRMGNYDTKGQVSKKFHEAYDETVRWVKLWRARQEAEQ